MKTTVRTSAILVASLAGVGAPALRAALITENFSGTVVAEQDLLTSGGAGVGGIFLSPVGTPITGTFTFNTASTTADPGNTSSLATYYPVLGTLTISALDAFGSFALTNMAVTGSISEQTTPGNDAWEIYIPRDPADEPISEYFDVGFGQPITGPVQVGTPIPPNGTVNTTALSYFPATLPSGVIGYSQLAVVNDPANRFSYVDLDITSLGTSTPEPATFPAACLLFAATLVIGSKRYRRLAARTGR